MDAQFDLQEPFTPTGDQPQAIGALVDALKQGSSPITLLGITGSGKTFSMAHVIAALKRPTLVISHNKTLAAQLCQEFREFFPKNAVEYFVSYYDYYQPEAYVPHTDTYIEKETEINDEIDRLRLSATASLLTRKDVIVVASVSCIYNLGSPKEYRNVSLALTTGQTLPRRAILKQLTRLSYSRSDIDFARGTFRVRGEAIDVYPGYLTAGIRIQQHGDIITNISAFDPTTGRRSDNLTSFCLFPAKHYIVAQDLYTDALTQIAQDCNKQCDALGAQGKLLEEARLRQRTTYDLEMIREFGYCNGIENYSRYFDGRSPGEPPYTLLDYFPKDYLLIIDESHMTIPQIRGMYAGDRSRKEVLIEYGFRLPSALDNRPLTFEEFLRRIHQVIYVSATPDEYEIAHSHTVVEQLIRPTGLLDPFVHVKPIENQIDDLSAECELRIARGERVLITTLTKRMAEDLTEYLKERGFKAHYLHSEIETLKRSDILDSLRAGTYDIVVGINLLREGIDLPEVSLVAILDADKEGFLRSTTSLIQVIGRAARHANGTVIMYADTITRSMHRAIEETQRRRKLQQTYNAKHGITPHSVRKLRRAPLIKQEETTKADPISSTLAQDPHMAIEQLRSQMHLAAKSLDFERAATLRDRARELEKSLRQKAPNG